MSRLYLCALCLLLAASAFALPLPEAPTATVVGTPGAGSATYWVVAEGPGNLFTAPSPPARVDNVPAKLSERDYVSLQVKPVEGAAGYRVLKLMPLAEPAPVTLTPAAPGETTYYYWIAPCCGFRYGKCYGPYSVQCGDPKGNVITWAPVNGASWYNVYRTDTPEPPVGRFHCIVAQQVGFARDLAVNYGASLFECKLTDPGRASFGVVGFPPEDLNRPPLGDGSFLLAKLVQAGEVRDTGQELRGFEAVHVNETERVAVTQYAEGQPSTRTFRGALVSGNINLPNISRPSFIAHISEMNVEQTVWSGGHNDYNGAGLGTPGWKSEIECLTTRQTSHTATQLAGITCNQNNYGTGDTSNIVSWTTIYGSNKDGGDEGTGPYWGQIRRVLEEIDDVVAATAARGAVALSVQRGDYSNAGTGRLLVNLSQAYSAGRIARVGNVDVHGKGTNWTREMLGRWISFDVDLVKGHRMWYQVTEVKSSTELTILARTGWSTACNLGYSRFIWDPETMPGPQPSWTNQDATYVLPKENEAAAKAGTYLLCLGTLLGAPWREGKRLNVEPLREEWKAGDKVQITPGPQCWMALSYWRLWGDYLPQDYITGINLTNYGSRPANTAGILIGNPGAANFSKGVEVYLANNGRGDGFVVSAANGWDERGGPAGNAGMYRGAFVAPVNLPALADEYNLCPRLIFTRPEQDLSKTTLSVQGPDRTPLMRFNWHDVDISAPLRVGARATFAGPVQVQGVLAGSEQTRGKVAFSGDGQATRFTVKFAKLFAGEPFVTISTNQFARARLAEVAADHLTVEFEQAPATGQNNVIVWWMAQE